LADLYLFNLGDGADTLIEYEVSGSGRPTGQVDVLRFAAGIAPTDITATRTGDNLVLAHSNGTDKVTVQNWYAGGTGSTTNQVERIEFADGSVWTNAQINNPTAQLTGTAEADVLAGLTNYTNTIDGAVGNDTITGGTLADFISGSAGNDILTGAAGADVLQGGTGDDVLWSNTVNGTTTDAGLLDGGAGDDTLNGGSVLAGGTGNDTLNLAAQPSVVLFNHGDGQDTIVNAAADTTISLGGGIGYSDIALSRSGSDLELNAGSTDKVTLKDWFATGGPQGVTKLQVISEAMPSFDASSSDPLLSKKVQEFDFGDFANGFEQAQAADPAVVNYSLMNQVIGFYVSSSDSAALGGDLAEYYGTQGSLTAMGLSAAQSVLTDTNFGAPQTLHGLASLQTGAVRLAA
jgi:Ca2+-binding RTX toxin-like protein